MGGDGRAIGARASGACFGARRRACSTILTSERQEEPRLVVDLHRDVLQGLRTLADAERLIIAEVGRQESTSPAYYGGLLNGIRELKRQGRVIEALQLAVLTFTAVEVLYGHEPDRWVDAAGVLIEAIMLADELLQARQMMLTGGPVLDLAPRLADELELRARSGAKPSALATALSIVGRYWHHAAEDRDDPDAIALLNRAAVVLRESAGLREGLGRGRALTRLAEVLIELAEHGAGDRKEAVRVAAEALPLIDRAGEPVPWVKARMLLFVFGGRHSLDDLLTAEDLATVRATRGAPAALACVVEQIKALMVCGMRNDAATMFLAAAPLLAENGPSRAPSR
jgi:hypothetical protein